LSPTSPSSGGGGGARAAKAPKVPRAPRPSATADTLTQLKYLFNPPLGGTASKASAQTAPLHKRLIVHDPLTIEVIALVHVAAGSIGGATSRTLMADAELTARANSLAQRIDRKKRGDLAPFVAALVAHTAVWQSTMVRNLTKFETVARPLLEADADDADLDLGVPLSASWDAGRRAAVPLIRLCRLCALHLFGLAYLRAGEIGMGRLFEEVALEDAIGSRSMQLCHSSCLSLAFVRWEQGGVLEAGHLFQYVHSVCADLADMPGTRYMRGCIAVTTAMLAREQGEPSLWLRARELAAASRIAAIEAYVLLRQPEISLADIELVLHLLQAEENRPTELCWRNFMVAFAHVSALLDVLARGAELTSAAARVNVRRRAKIAVAEFSAHAEQWAVSKPRALFFEARLAELSGQPAAAHDRYSACIRLATEHDLEPGLLGNLANRRLFQRFPKFLKTGPQTVTIGRPLWFARQEHFSRPGHQHNGTGMDGGKSLLSTRVATAPPPARQPMGQLTAVATETATPLPV
jgi:hypothetical protein